MPKVHKLSQLTQSKHFRLAMEQAFKVLLTRQVCRDDRIWLFIYKTKLYRVMRLNYTNFYLQQTKKVEKLKFDSEIAKDLKRTFPEKADFSSPTGPAI